MRVQRVALFLVSFSFVVLVWFGLCKLSLLCPLCAVYFILFPRVAMAWRCMLATYCTDPLLCERHRHTPPKVGPRNQREERFLDHTFLAVSAVSVLAFVLVFGDKCILSPTYLPLRGLFRHSCCCPCPRQTLRKNAQRRCHPTPKTESSSCGRCTSPIPPTSSTAAGCWGRWCASSLRRGPRSELVAGTWSR